MRRGTGLQLRALSGRTSVDTGLLPSERTTALSLGAQAARFLRPCSVLLSEPWPDKQCWAVRQRSEQSCLQEEKFCRSVTGRGDFFHRFDSHRRLQEQIGANDCALTSNISAAQRGSTVAQTEIPCCSAVPTTAAAVIALGKASERDSAWQTSAVRGEWCIRAACSFVRTVFNFAPQPYYGSHCIPRGLLVAQH